MDAFTQTIGSVSAICLGIFAVSIFFTLWGYVKRLGNKADSRLFSPQDFIKKETLVTVHLSEGQILESVKFQGFTQGGRGGPDSRIPFEISKMAVFVKSDGTKIFVRAKAINSIQELPLQA